MVRVVVKGFGDDPLLATGTLITFAHNDKLPGMLAKCKVLLGLPTTPRQAFLRERVPVLGAQDLIEGDEMFVLLEKQSVALVPMMASETGSLPWPSILPATPRAPAEHVRVMVIRIAGRGTQFNLPLYRTREQMLHLCASRVGMANADPMGLFVRGGARVVSAHDLKHGQEVYVLVRGDNPLDVPPIVPPVVPEGGRTGRAKPAASASSAVAVVGAKQGVVSGQEFEEWSESQRFQRWRAKVKKVQSPFAVQFLKLKAQNPRQALLNMTCGCIVQEPRYYDTANEARMAMVKIAVSVVNTDPEFLLKLSLHVRDDLNIRTTANFLLSLAAHIKPCQVYLRKYFPAIIKTPGDMLEFVNLYRTVPNRMLSPKSFPRSTRRVLTERFARFDDYQLGKYCSDASRRRKLAKNKPKVELGALADAAQFTTAEAAEADEEAEDFFHSQLSMKSLIRQLHIAHPRRRVLQIIGHKYPASPEEFDESGLPGRFDPSQVGSRLKLPVPKTWDRMVSQAGNNAAVWEDLIDSRKLPYFAMLRNLSNVLRAGVSQRHLDTVCRYLTSRDAVTRSRLLPVRYWSAHNALDFLETKTRKARKDFERAKIRERKAKAAAKATSRARGSSAGTSASASASATAAKTNRAKMATAKMQGKYVAFRDPQFGARVQQVRDALGAAVETAVRNNIPTVGGRTLVLCDVGPAMAANSVRYPAVRKAREMSVLMSLMLYRRCADLCLLRAFGASADVVEIGTARDQSILDNMRAILKDLDQAAHVSANEPAHFPVKYFSQLLDRRVKVDNLVVLSGGYTYGNATPAEIAQMIGAYRRNVNPNVVLFSVDLLSSGTQLINEFAPNNVFVSGLGEHVLRFIAEREQSQLETVLNIDKRKKLRDPNADVEADAAADDAAQRLARMAPRHYVCPLTKEVMVSPCVAADGHTYDELAIVNWFQTSSKSPVTGIDVRHKAVTPNYALRAAIARWREEATVQIAKDEQLERIETLVETAIESGEQQAESIKEAVAETQSGIEQVLTQLQGAAFELDVSMREWVPGAAELQPVFISADASGRDVFRFRVGRGFALSLQLRQTNHLDFTLDEVVSVAISGVRCVNSAAAGATDAAADGPGEVEAGVMTELPIASVITQATGNSCTVLCHFGERLEVRENEDGPREGAAAGNPFAQALSLVSPRGSHYEANLELLVMIKGVRVPLRLRHTISFRVFPANAKFLAPMLARAVRRRWDETPGWAKFVLRTSVRVAVRAVLL